MFQGNEKLNRISNASTVDDIEVERIDMQVDEEEFDINKHLHLFDKLNEQQNKHYDELRDSLQRVYVHLAQEIEPVCIRDICTLQSKSIELKQVSVSCITRRRESVLAQR